MKYTRLFYQCESHSSLRSANEVVPQICEYIKPRTVVDVGCGVGAWLRAFLDHGATEVWGIDGESIDNDMLLIPKERFLRCDLTQPLRPGIKADLAICLEVAEHLPEASAVTLVESLVKLAPVVVFSAAIPYQFGTHHINEQWQDYWVEKFSMHGYLAVDCIRSRIWNNPRVDFWYAQNMLMFVNQAAIGDHPLIAHELNAHKNPLYNVVHPKLYLTWADPKRITLRKFLTTLRGFAYAPRNSILPRLQARRAYRSQSL